MTVTRCSRYILSLSMLPGRQGHMLYMFPICIYIYLTTSPPVSMHTCSLLGIDLNRFSLYWPYDVTASHAITTACLKVFLSCQSYPHLRWLSTQLHTFSMRLISGDFRSFIQWQTIKKHACMQCTVGMHIHRIWPLLVTSGYYDRYLWCSEAWEAGIIHHAQALKVALLCCCQITRHGYHILA